MGSALAEQPRPIPAEERRVTPDRRKTPRRSADGALVVAVTNERATPVEKFVASRSADVSRILRIPFVAGIIGLALLAQTDNAVGSMLRAYAHFIFP